VHVQLRCGQVRVAYPRLDRSDRNALSRHRRAERVAQVVERERGAGLRSTNALR
jgi:hypothetical protein